MCNPGRAAREETFEKRLEDAKGCRRCEVARRGLHPGREDAAQSVRTRRQSSRRQAGRIDAPHLAVATKEGIRLLLLSDEIEALDESFEHVEWAGEASEGSQKERDE